MSVADEFRKLAEQAKARAEGKEGLCHDVLLSVSEAYAVMARVQEDFERTSQRTFPARDESP